MVDSMTMFSKILIANRGELSENSTPLLAMMPTAKRLGVKTVAVYSDADKNALHVELADEAVHIGPPPVSESYLQQDTIIKAAQRTGAQAIHPGYGFLSENPEFVGAVESAGLTFIGPSAKAISAMGLKDAAKQLMQDAGVPIVPGYHGADQTPDLLKSEADKIGYPVLIKARAGGGGKGMRLVEQETDFLSALESAAREGQTAFGDPAVLIEKFITSPRHIEVQVFGVDRATSVFGAWPNVETT
jgi:3-methylcrotonyl-CoA carboxylase alpha subunit